MAEPIRYEFVGTDAGLLDLIKKIDTAVVNMDSNILKAGVNIDSTFSNLNKGAKNSISVMASLKKTISSLSTSQLIDFKPKNINEANAAIQELTKRRNALNKTDKNYLTTLGQLNNKQAVLIQQNKAAASTGLQVAKSNAKITQSYAGQSTIVSQLRNQMAGLFGIYGAQRFLKQMVKIRGEFELQSVALSAMLQDKKLANELFLEVQAMALESPFKILELNSYVKQLKAFRIENDELISTLQMLGDTSAGVGVDMSRLILAYGQVKSAEFLRGQEVRQFTEAGIPILGALADQFTELEGRAVSVNEVFEKISNRLVPFEMVKQVFVDMTREGGIFYDQQRLQAHTLSGEVSILIDKFELMMNTLGKANEGGLKGAIKFGQTLVDNYEQVWAVLKKLITAYGIYKAALIFNNIIIKRSNILMLRQIVAFKAFALSVAGSAKTLAAFRSAAFPILAVLGLIATAISVYSSKQKKLREELRATLKPITDQAIELQKLRGALEESTGKEGDRLDIISDLNKVNKLVNSEILTEKNSLEELNEVIEENIKLNRIKFALATVFDDPKGGLEAKRAEFREKETALFNTEASASLVASDLISAISQALAKEPKIDLGEFVLDDFTRQVGDDPLKALLKLQKDLATAATDGSKTLKEEFGVINDIFFSEIPSGFLYDAKLVKEEYSLWESAVDYAETQARQKISELVASRQLSQELADQLLIDRGLLDASAKAATDVIYSNWKGMTLAIESIDFQDPTLKFLSPEKYKDTAKDFESFIDTTAKQYKELEDRLKKYTSSKIVLENELLSIGNNLSDEEKNNYSDRIKSLQDTKDELELQKKALFDVLDYWNALYLVKGKGGSKDLFKTDKEYLKFIKDVRDFYLNLGDVTKDTSFSQIGGDEFKKQIKTVFGDVGFNKDVMKTLFESYTDKDFRKYLETLRDSSKATGTKAGKEFAEALSLEIANIKKQDIIDEQKFLAETEKLRNELLGVFAPFGDGFIFDVTLITTKSEEDIQKITDEYRRAMQGANSEQLRALTGLRDREIEGIRQVRDERIENLIAGSVKKELGVLEQFYTNINEASLYQIKQVDKAIEELSKIQIKPIDLISPELPDTLGLTRKEIEDVLSLIQDGSTFDDTIMTTFGLTEEQLKVLDDIIQQTGIWNNELDGVVKKWEDLSDKEKLERLGQCISDIGSSLSSLGTAIGQLNQELGDTIKGLGEVADFAGKIISAIASGNVVAIIGTVIEGIAKIITAEAREAEEWRTAQTELRSQIAESIRAYDIWKNEVIRGNKLIYDSFGNVKLVQDDIFGIANPFSEAISGANALRDAIDLLETKSYSLKLDTGNGPEIIAEFESLQKALGLAKIQTGNEKYGGFLGIGQKTRETYSSLAEYLDVDEIDIFSEEQLQQALANYDLLDDKTKKLVDDWEAYSEADDEAIAQINDSISDLVGNLAGDFSETMVDAFINGTDAADGMRDSVEGIVEAMLEQMLTATLLGPVFEQMQKDMYASMGLTADGKADKSAVVGVGAFDQDFSDDIAKNWAEFDVENVIANWSDQMQGFKDQFQDFGLDLWSGDDEFSGLSSGIQSVTEDTANIIAAYMNTIRNEVILHTGYFNQIIAISQSTQSIATSQLTELIAIRDNTAGMLKILDDVTTGIKTLRVA